MTTIIFSIDTVIVKEGSGGFEIIIEREIDFEIDANISGVLINWTPIITDVRYAYMKKPKVTSTGTKPVMGVINEQQLSIKKPTGLRGTYQKDNYNVDSS